MEQIKPFDAITPDHIQNWKAKYGDVLSEVNIGDARFVVRIPSRRAVDLVAQLEHKKDIVGMNNTMINNCVLGGDMESMENDGSIYTDLLTQIGKLIERKKVSVKKL